MNNIPLNITQELSVILNQLKSKNEISKQLSLKQLITYLNNNREYTDEIIDEMSKFLDNEKQSIEDFYFYKIITNFCSKLEENNLSTNKFINKILPILMDKIYYYQQYKSKNDNLLFNIIADFTKKCQNNTGQIEFNLNTVFEKLKDEKNPPDDSTKFALITVLSIFVHNAPLLSFSKIMKSTNGFRKIISDFKNKDENIRKAVQKLIEEFLLILLDKDSFVRIKQSKNIIYDVCIKDYLDKKNNNNEYIIHGLILVMKSFTIKKNGRINELFKEKFKIFLEFLNSNVLINNNLIKLSIIECLPSFCEYFHIFMEENEYLDYFRKILNNLQNIYSEKKIDEKIKFQILKTFGKLSVIESLKEPFSEKILSIIGILRNDILESKKFSESILDCFSDFMKYYGQEFIAILTFDVYYEKMFSCGLSESHINFLKKILKQYDKNSNENIQIIICILNVVSFIITDNKFNFKTTEKKMGISSVIQENKGEDIVNKKNINNKILTLNLIEQKTPGIKNNLNLNNTDIKYFNNAGKAICSYIKDRKDKGIDYSKEIKNALILLSFIDNEIFRDDILTFYLEKCIHIFHNSNNEIKKELIELANSPWIPSLEDTKNTKKRNIEYNLNYILEYYLNLLLNESEDEIKLLILKSLDDKRYFKFLSKNNFFLKFATIIEYDNNLIKEKSLEIISKIISYNYNTIFTYIREKVLQIYLYLVTSNNIYRKEENIILLSFFIKYVGNYIVEELENLLPTLLKILREEANYKNNNIVETKKQNDMIILGILSVISELIKNDDYNQSQLEFYINDIMSISINILADNLSKSSIKEETALNTIFSILINSNKNWNIYSDYKNLVNLIIQVLSKSQNKKSRLYAMKILGYIGTINPNKLNSLLNLNISNNKNDINEENELNLDKEKNKSLNLKDKNQNNKLKLIEKYKKYDFLKAINEKTLDSNTYYSMKILMKILLNNNNYDVSTRIIILLKDILEKLGPEDYAIINLILPILLSSINNFEENSRILILEVILLILNNFIEESLSYAEDILILSESYLTEDSKSKITDNGKQIKDICLDIIDKLCESYSNEISTAYPRIIPMILGMLSDKDDSISTKRKVISILTNIDNSLSNYLYLIIPELTSCLNSLINKIKISPSVNSSGNTKGMVHLRTSSLFSNNLNTNKKNIDLSNFMSNYNDNTSTRTTINEIGLKKPFEAKKSIDISLEKKLEQDILNLMDNLLNLPGIIKYMEQIIRILCIYMEANHSCQDIIMKMFIKILDNFQNEFIVFYPHVLNFSKRIGIPCLNYFKEFRFGLEKREIMSLFAKEKLTKKNILPHIGNVKPKDNNILNKSLDSSSDGNGSLNKSGNSPIVTNLPNKSISNMPHTGLSKQSLTPKINKKVNNSPIKNYESIGLNRDINKGTIDLLVKEFDTNNCLSEEDWHEWFKNCTKKLFEQSPSYIIFSCHKNNVYDPQVINELYNSAFYSLWKKCGKKKRELAKNLQIILKNSKTPNDILLTVLNLIEYINKEDNEEFDLVEFEVLGKIADICRAYAKALYYVENGYINNDFDDDLIKLINLYINLELPESAMGIYRLTKKKSKTSFSSLLNEKDLNLKLHQWKKAMQKIEEQQKQDEKKEKDNNLLIKKAICLEGLSDWENLLELGDDLSKIELEKEKIKAEEDIKFNASLALSIAALNLGDWDKLKKYTSTIKSSEDNEIYEENFFKAIVAIKDEEYVKAKQFIDIARDSIDEKIKALLNESYERAYKLLLDNENLCQLEDIIKLKKINANKEEYQNKKEKLKLKWNKSLELKEEDIRTYERIIGIRKIIFNPEEDYLSSLRLSQICRKKDKFTTCMLVLNRLKKSLINTESNIGIRVELEIGKCLHDNYDEPENLNKAIQKLEEIVNKIDKVEDPIKSKIYCYYSVWRAEKMENNLNEKDVNNILKNLTLSTKYNDNNYKAWHSFALLNYKFFEHEKKTKLNYAKNAIEGFAKSICIGGKNISKILKDLLLLLNIWFQVGMDESIDKLMNEKIDTISLDSWILVIPQLLARINVTNPLIRNTLILLLKKIGLVNPRSLTYPLTVLQNSKSKIRAEAVSIILTEIKQKHEQLFKECELIINELNRCALCLHEQWSESLEESAKLFFQSKDIKTSTKILVELHKKMKNPPKTMNEMHFHQLYRGELREANRLLQEYLENNNLVSYKEAWDIYHSCFRSIAQNFSNFESLDLESISPELFKFKESEIEIPGTYQNNDIGEESSLVKISSFSRNLVVLNSKQHPRKIVIYGSNGKEYPFLLKGHEDIRQDERVMQLFGLVNTLLMKDPATREKNLLIKRYPVIPLSHNTGIIGWVSNCDTLHQLIKDYRQINKVPLNIEHRLMAKMHPKFDTSLSMTKLEVFKYSLFNTLGNDLYKVLWNKSQNAEDWLDRRTTYSRSLAVMSIIGYILGLGDRHPSNIMVDRNSGKVLHIDFGDCFEVAMKREKFPEKVPFRLTRMLIKALEIGGIEGAFRITCENVMRVVRENKDSLNVILAAFVHDPLISFRLLIPLIMKQAKNKNKINNIDDKKKKNNEQDNNETNKKGQKMMEEIINNSKKDENELEKKRIGSDERQLYNELEEKDDTESDDLNQIAKIVLERVSDKLNGTDFNKNEELKIYDQIQRLIKQATSHKNLSQSYLGWCPFW